MQADAVVLLGPGNMDVPPTWVRPGAVVIRCEPTLETGIVQYTVIISQSLFKHLSYSGKEMTLNPSHLHSVFFVLDEHAIEISSKSGLGFLTAAYRTRVLLFVSSFSHYSLTIFAVFTVPYLVISPFLFTRMWCIVAVVGSRNSSTDPGIYAASNCSPWPLYQGIAHDPWGPTSTWKMGCFSHVI